MPNYGSNLDLKQNQLLNAIMQRLTTAPSNPVSGQFYFNTTSGIARAFYYNGTDWVAMDGMGATMTADNITVAINNSSYKIDDDNLSTNVNNAIANNHTHANKTILDNATASFKTAQETKLGYITVTSAVNLNSLETTTGAQDKATTAENNAKAYADTAVANLVASAPDALNTLNELAQALGDDANFATTMTNELAKKSDKYTTTIGDGVNSSFTITHNLNSRDVIVMIRETASPYDMWLTDIAFTTTNTITVSYGFIPTTNQFTVTVIG